MLFSVRRSGFTLVELLLTVGIIGSLSSITITALNPTKQLTKTNDAAVMVGSKFVQDALRQATIDTSSSWDATILPQGIDARIPLCAQGHTCTGGINLDSVLVPKFISLIPRDSRETDSTRSGFEVYRDAANRPVVVATANFKYSTGILDTSFNPGAGADSTVYGYTVQSDEKMIIYGSFSNYAGVARNKLARVNTDGTLDTSFSIGTGPSVNALPSDVLILSDGKILVVGSFTSFNGSARRQLVRLNADGSVDTTFDTGTGPNGTFVGTPLIQSDGKMIVYGNFTLFNGVARGGVARLNTDGSLDTSFAPSSGVAPAFSTIGDAHLQSDGKVILMGAFTSYNGTARNRIVRVNTDGSLDTSFDPGTGPAALYSWSTVSSFFAQSDGKLIISGTFNAYNGVPRNSIARINTDGSLDKSFNPGTGMDYNGGTELGTILRQSNGKFVLYGANLLSYNGTPRTHLARISADGTLDAPYANATFSSNVVGISMQGDGKVYAWGYFTSFGGVNRYLVLRLNANGTLDDTFNPLVNNLVKNVGVLKDGRAVIMGDFTTINGEPANRIAVLK